MKTKLMLGLIAVSAFACASETETAGDPLENFEELDPVTILDATSANISEVAPANRAAVRRGEYMAELLGCGTCHTNGALTGEPDTEHPMSGSDVGIAYQSPLLTPNPGIVFPPNITSDIKTGIGGWSDEQLAAAIRQGAGRHSPTPGFVMPWPGYAKLSDEDTSAIILYLRNTKPTEHAVPDNIPTGRTTNEAFVYFGIYWEN